MDSRDLEFAHQEAEESIDAYYRRYTARSRQEHRASSLEALAERAAERLPLEPETEAEAAWWKRHFHRSVVEVLKSHGLIYRNLCYEHHCSEFDELPSVSRWQASTWRTVERADCEICGKVDDA